MDSFVLCPDPLRTALAGRLAALGLPAREIPRRPSDFILTVLRHPPALLLFAGGAACLPLLRRIRAAGYPGHVALLLHTPDPALPAVTDPTQEALSAAWRDIDTILPTQSPTDAELAALCATARRKAARLSPPTPWQGLSLAEAQRAAETAHAQKVARTTSGTRAAAKLGTKPERLRKLLGDSN